MGHEFNSRKPNLAMGELLCEELIEEILFRLTNIDSLIKCKYVSKSWSHLVCNVCCRRGPIVGLIGLYSNSDPFSRVSSELWLLHPPFMKQEDEVEDNVDAKRARRANEQPRLMEKREIDYVMETTKCLDLYQLTHLLDSCNGLILCRCFDEDVQCYYVSNPILNQWRLLPPPPIQECYAAIGFVFDGIQGHHYKVLHLFMRETSALVTNRIQCQIFSSETGHWREHQATILNSLTTLSHCIKLIRVSSIQKQGLYRNGALHWTFAYDHKYMLVFYVEKEAFRFVELPGDHGSTVDRVAKCLWETKGFLHYAVSMADDTFHVWKNTNVHGDIDDKQHRWVRIRTVMYHSMLQENPEDPKVLILTYEGCLSHKSGIVCVPRVYFNNGSRVVILERF